MATVTAPPERWALLGPLLRARRVDVDPRYRTRSALATDTGLNDRFIADLENGRRTTYRDENLQAVERAYRLRPGSIQRLLDGRTDELDPLPEESEQPAEESGAAAPLSAPPADSGDPADEQWDETITGPPLLREGETLRYRRLGGDSVRYALTRHNPNTGTPEHILYTFDGEWSRDAQFVVKFFRYQLEKHSQPHRRTDPPNGHRED